MKKAVFWAAALAVGWSAPAGAQSIESACEGIPAGYQERCLAVAQAAVSAQPALGIAIAGGNPTPGRASTGGARLLPNFSLSAGVNLTSVHLPGITVEDDALAPSPPTQELTVLTVALGATASAALTGGFDLAPAVGGLGAIDLLASGSYLPYDLINRDVFKPSSAQFSWGAGVRVGLLRESLAVPGVSVSVMRRGIGDVQIGNVCEDDQEPDAASDGSPPSTLCRQSGDIGSVELGVDGWSTRGVVSKHLMGVGVAIGVGYDRFESDVRMNVRGERAGAGALSAQRLYQLPGRSVESARWNAFLDLSYTVGMGAVAAELGWMQGDGETVPGFPAASAFDPGAGTIFGSLGARFSI